MAATPSGHGYWFTASDGGVFAFGDAGFYGSLGSVPQSRPVVAMGSTSDGQGYWFTNNNGGVTAYGDATYWGSAPQVLAQPVVGMAEAPGSGHFTASAYPSGSLGYDISNYQCGGFPPPPHTIGIVQVVGASFAPVNPCLAAEAAWAGAGLNLYVFLTYGNANSSGDPNCASEPDPSTCNYGFDAALDAFAKAEGAGIDTAVAWWLDVEGGPSWSPSTASNASVVQGALDGLHSVGINSVGIYASPGSGTGSSAASRRRCPTGPRPGGWIPQPPAPACAASSPTRSSRAVRCRSSSTARRAPPIRSGASISPSTTTTPADRPCAASADGRRRCSRAAARFPTRPPTS